MATRVIIKKRDSRDVQREYYEDHREEIIQRVIENREKKKMGHDPAPVGRPKKYLTEEERREANKERCRKYRERNNLTTIAITPNKITPRVEDYLKTLVESLGPAQVLAYLFNLSHNNPVIEHFVSNLDLLDNK